MKKLTPKGIIGLSTTAFLFLVLMSIIYLNNQVEFNPVQAKWELKEQYQIDSVSYITGTSISNYLSFDGINDYLKIDYSPSLNIGTDSFNINFDAQIYDGGTNDFGILFSSNFFATAPFIVVYYGNGEMLIRVSSNGNNNQSFYRFPIDNELNNYDLTFNNLTDNWVVLVNDVPVSLELLDQDTVGDINFSTPYYIGVEDSLASGDFLRFDLYSFQYTIANDLVIDYDMTYFNNVLIDNSNYNNNAEIYNVSINTTESIIQIPQLLNSYDAFENIRNNASIANPLSFMNILVSIPSQAIGYMRSFTNFINFDLKDSIIDFGVETILGPESGYWQFVEWFQGLGD